MRTLMDQAHGAYLVRTTASRYLISLDLHIVRRHPDAGPPIEVAALRRDHEQLDLLSVYECTVGKSMELIVDLHLPNVPFTVRRSMPVLSIERLTDAEEAVLL
jgi:hypothetical protein